VLIVAVAVVAAWVCAKFNLSEALLNWTRPFERLQLDELRGTVGGRDQPDLVLFPPLFRAKRNFDCAERRKRSSSRRSPRTSAWPSNMST